MRWLARIFAQALARRVAFVVVAAVLAWFGMGRAEAATQQQVATTCINNASTMNASSNSYWYACYEYTSPPVTAYATCGIPRNGSNSAPSGIQSYSWSMGCYTSGAGPWAWDSACPNGMDNATGQCKPDDAQCRAKNTEPGFAGVGEITTNYREGCFGGCLYKPVAGTPVVSSGSGADLLVTADFEFTGACPASNPPPTKDEGDVKPTDPQKCVNYGTGQTFCQKANGEQCYSASTGRQICWKPGETGEKTDGPVKQKRDAGPSEIPPSLTLPNGDTLQKQGQSKTTNTTISNNNSTQNITTTTTNYFTQNGTNAGTSNQGQPADGSGSPDGGEGDGTSATGGADCDTPPVVQGDAALNMVANQAWSTRCAVEAGNAAKVTGDINNCSQPFTVEGSNANAVKLRAMRKQVCPMEGESMTQDGGDGASDSDTDVWGEGTTIDGSTLDQSGWVGGGGTCIGIPNAGTGILSNGFMADLASPPPQWCEYIQWIYAVVVALATITGVFILSGWKGS